MPHTSEQAALYGARGQGKKTPAGRLRSSRNAFKHGLRAAKLPLLMGEDLTQFEGIIQSLVDQYQPQGAAEIHLIEVLAMSILKQHRLWNAEAAMLNRQIMQANQQEAFPDLVVKGEMPSATLLDRVIPHRQTLKSEQNAIRDILEGLRDDLKQIPPFMTQSTRMVIHGLIWLSARCIEQQQQTTIGRRLNSGQKREH